MAKVQVTKSWTVTPNERLTPYVSLAATLGWWVYKQTVAMLAAGWTCKFSSTGLVGPASGADTTNRITSAGDFVTRATIAASPQSWIVLQNVDGVQVLFAFQGASDDIARVSMSQSGAFTVAGTTTHQPTATDEIIGTTGGTLINATTSGDRVMSIGCTTESWWCATYRSAVLINFISVDKIDSACSTATLAQPYIISKIQDPKYYVQSGQPGGSISATAVGAAGWLGFCTRVFTVGAFRNIAVGGGGRSVPDNGVNSSNLTYWTAVRPALQAGTSIPLFKLDLMGKATDANSDGYLGSPIDWWFAITNSNATPTQGDMIGALAPGDTQATALRSNWLVAFGAGVIRPWLNAAASLITA